MEPKDPANDPESKPDPDSTLSPGDIGGTATGWIGPYRLVRMLGEGGMGEVWLAEQKKPLHRTLALKLIKPGMDTKTVVARFESERQALALMEHPNIAKVFDAGFTPEGRPYFVMEYVPGLPITEYCDSHRLDMKKRLELFMQVCDGVQHAHQKAIIHRDLKPSNVLVVEQDNKPIPKIIDFGLAKALAQRLTEKTMFTELGVLVGTPEYMSPEQADQREQNIDTRTDVYSLGVILYELLVGALPFDARALRAAGFEAILRVIREQEPQKPSTKVRSMGDGSAAAAEKRGEEPRSFARRLQGELDWITMKALEKDRARRYGTASEFAADISRYLRREPVVAGPATAAYRIKKYAARHRFGLAAAAALVILLAGFAVTQTVELHRIRLERDRANRERDRANRITDFMTGMFKVSDPSEAKGNTITAREILDKASNEIQTNLTKDPELQAQMMFTMGTVYDNLGLYSRAQLLQQNSFEIRQRLLGQNSPETLKSMFALAWTLWLRGLYPAAETLQRRTLDLQRRVLGPENPDTLLSMNSLANILWSEGRYADAEKLQRKTLNARRRILGPENRDTLSSMNNLANILDGEGHYAEAEQLDREALDVFRRVLGPENLQTMQSMNDLAADLDDEGRYAEAEQLDRETLDICRRILGPEHPQTLNLMNNLANVLDQEGRYAQAKKLNRETLDIRRRVLGPEHPETLLSMSNLANDLGHEGRYGDAEKLDRETLDIRRHVLGPEHPDTLTSMGNLAADQEGEGHYAAAEKLYREVLDIRRRVLGPEHPETAYSTYNLACVLTHEDRRSEAFSLLREAVDHRLPPSADLNVDKDPDLKPLHGDPRFAALVAHAKEVAAAALKPNSANSK